MSGCNIVGRWYEVLSDTELMSSIQEVRDLVRYTPISVELNGRLITRDPRNETWDAEDEFAYYRVKPDGAVSIYNQGVLIRHDATHLWGAGGLIVSKKAIGLNVSRTEILRKTCPVWKPIAKRFGAMADEMASRLGDHRKTEARREKSARALLSGDTKIALIYDKEEVVTLLPGKRHVTMHDFLRKCGYSHNKRQGRAFAVVESGFDVPKGEAIAREGIAVILHPQTLERFGCYNAQDFRDCIDRINSNVREDVEKNHTRFWNLDFLYVPDLLDFTTLRDAFLDRTQLTSEKDALDKETRRAWTALRWCLRQYARLCTGGHRTYGSQTSGGKSFDIVLGDSNRAEAWTDGSSYIAVDVKIVKRLSASPMKTAAYIFSLIEHEVAHEGDSLDCGHDEAFFQRFHDLALQHSEDRQHYMHKWLMKYTTSMEGEGKRAAGEAWRERYLVDRAGSGRVKKGLSPAIEDVRSDPDIAAPVPAENMAFIAIVNAGLVQAGQSPIPPDWAAVFDVARKAQAEVEAEMRREAQEQAENDRANFDDIVEEVKRDRLRLATLLNVSPDEIGDDALDWLMTYESGGGVDARARWAEKPWERHHDEYPDHMDADDTDYVDAVDEHEDWMLRRSEAMSRVPMELQALVQPGETAWALERNAAAAGFDRVEGYLRWRAQDAPG